MLFLREARGKSLIARFAVQMRLVSGLYTPAGTANAGIARRPASKRLTGLGAKKKSVLRLHEGVTDHLFDTREEVDYNAMDLRH